MTCYGVVASLIVVSLVLTFLVTLAFFAGTLLRNALLAAVLLVFVWFPVNLVLHTFSLEEFSPHQSEPGAADAAAHPVERRTMRPARAARILRTLPR